MLHLNSIKAYIVLKVFYGTLMLNISDNGGNLGKEIQITSKLKRFHKLQYFHIFLNLSEIKNGIHIEL